MRSLLLILCVFVVAHAQTGNQANEERSDPITTLSSYYDAINSKDFRRAYRYRDSPTSSYEQFAKGFADTDHVRLLVELPLQLEGAAGDRLAGIPPITAAPIAAGNGRA